MSCPTTEREGTPGRKGKDWTDDRAQPTFIARDLAEAAERLVALA